MRLTSLLAFILSFALTLAVLLYALPEREEEDLPSYVRGTVRLEGSAIQ